MVSRIFSVGNSPKVIEMSIAMMISSHIRAKSSASNVSSALRNLSRLRLARLQLELSRERYSLHGLLAVMRPVSGLVCQLLIVSSYCRPGSAQSQAAWEILRNSPLASTVSMVSPDSRALRPNSLASWTARMNSSLTRTELLAFWYWTEMMSEPPRSMSNPASRRARILFSSLALVSTKSTMSG